MTPEQKGNPLAAQHRKAQAAPSMHPMKAHATVWQHVNNMPTDTQKQKLDEIEYSLPILGSLAGKPDVSSKDVIRAAADAAGAGKIAPSQAVEMISQMPDDPTKLRAWLKQLYVVNLTAAVHLKAAMMPAPQQPAAQPAAMPQPAPMKAAPTPPQGNPLGAAA